MHICAISSLNKNRKCNFSKNYKKCHEIINAIFTKNYVFARKGKKNKQKN